MTVMTHREYTTRLAWLDFVDRNRPGKVEEYLMQVAQRIVQFAGFGGGKDRLELPLDSQRLEWGAKPIQPAYGRRELAARQAAAIRSTLVGAAGGKARLVDGPRVPLPPSMRQPLDEEDIDG